MLCLLCYSLIPSATLSFSFSQTQKRERKCVCGCGCVCVAVCVCVSGWLLLASTLPGLWNKCVSFVFNLAVHSTASLSLLFWELWIKAFTLFVWIGHFSTSLLLQRETHGISTSEKLGLSDSWRIPKTALLFLNDDTLICDCIYIWMCFCVFVFLFASFCICLQLRAWIHTPAS